MEEHFNTFIQIWNDYSGMLPNWYEVDVGCKIITKIKQNNYDFVKDNETKEILIRIIYDISRLHYYNKYKDNYDFNKDGEEDEDKFEDDYEDYFKNTLDKETNSCYQIKLYLEKL